MSGSDRVVRRFLCIALATVAAILLTTSNAVAAGELAIEPGEVSFGVLLPGKYDSKSLTVRNTGPDSVQLSDIYIAGDVDPFEFLGGSCDLGTMLPADGECTLTLMFAPADAGDFEVALIVEGGPGEEPAVATLTGRSRPPGTLVPSPSLVDFGAVRLDTVSAPRSVSIHNDGGTPIDIDIIYANGATIVSNGCGSKVEPLATCEVSMTFRPYAFSTWTSEKAIQTSELMIRALAWDQRPPRRLKIAIPMRATALRTSGEPFPTRQELARSYREDLRRMTGASIRLVRGGPTRLLSLPRFRGGVHGRLGFTMRARVGKRWVVIARAVTAVDWKASAQLTFRLTKRGKRLLRGSEPTRIEATAHFRGTDRSIVDPVAETKRAKVKPVAEPKKKRKRR